LRRHCGRTLAGAQFLQTPVPHRHPFRPETRGEVHRAAGASDSRAERNIRSARERLLHHLALAAGPDGRTVELPGSVVDLAAELGLTHEALYRTIAALENERAIARTGSVPILCWAPDV